MNTVYGPVPQSSEQPKPNLNNKIFKDKSF